MILQLNASAGNRQKTNKVCDTHFCQRKILYLFPVGDGVQALLASYLHNECGAHPGTLALSR